jgi:hypothetical protein
MLLLVQAFTLACEYMYTGRIEALEDAEVAINVWMVASALVISSLPQYVHKRILEILPTSHLHILPGVFRQANAASILSRASTREMEEQGSAILQTVMEYILCKLQVRTLRRRDIHIANAAYLAPKSNACRASLQWLQAAGQRRSPRTS